MSLSKPNTKHPFYKWEILAFLWVAFFLNQADRQIFNVLLTSIKADLLLSDAQMGFIATTFNFAFATLVPISGLLGDRISKRNILVFSILLWSIATMPRKQPPHPKRPRPSSSAFRRSLRVQEWRSTAHAVRSSV